MNERLKYVKCEWCGHELLSENATFTEAGRLLDPGCYITVFDEHFDQRVAAEEQQ